MKTKILSLRPSFLFSLTFILPLLSFAIPFLVSGPQILTGSLVNFFLLSYTYKFSRKNILPIIVLPSIAAFLNGVVFGPLTLLVLPLIPFIWMANFLFIKTFLFLKSKRLLFRIIPAALLKSLFLFSVAFVYINLKILPFKFLSLMGTGQLATSLLGGLLFLTLCRFLKNNE